MHAATERNRRKISRRKDEFANGQLSVAQWLTSTFNLTPDDARVRDPSNRTLWKITANDAGFTLNERNSAPVFTMLESGNLTITGTLTTGGGTCGGGCDKVFEDDYDLPTIEEHSEAMWSNGYLPNVGPTIENEPINVSDKVGRMLNELEKAHIYIDQLNEENKILKERLDKLEQRLQ